MPERICYAPPSGSRLSLVLLASVLQHELHHLNGANEQAARRAERELLVDLVRRNVLRGKDADRYLAALAGQPPPAGHSGSMASTPP